MRMYVEVVNTFTYFCIGMYVKVDISDFFSMFHYGKRGFYSI